MTKWQRFWLLFGNFCAYLTLIGAAFVAVAFDGFGGGGGMSHNIVWPLITAGIAPLTIWYVSQRIKGTIAGAATGFALAGFACFLVMTFMGHVLVAASVTIIVGIVAMIFAITTALTGTFTRFHRGLAWVGLTTLIILNWFTVLMLTNSFKSFSPNPEWLIFLPLPLCLYPLILCSFWVRPVD